MINSNVNIVSQGVKKLYLPKNLSVDYLKKQFGKYSDDAIFLISTIIQQKAYRRLNPNDFIPLSATLLNNTIGKHYNLLVKKLVIMGIVERNDSYRAGELYKEGFCKSFNLGVKFRDQDFHMVDCKTSVSSQKLTKTEEWLKDNFLKLEMDYSEDMNSYDRIIADSINSKNILFSKDSFGNRIHTHLTYLKSDLRKCLRVGNERLVSFDRKNSQIYDFCIVVKKLLLKKYRMNNYSSLNKELNSSSSSSSSLSLPICLEKTHYPALFTEEIEKMFSLTIGGIFYDFLLENTPDFKGNRDQFKPMFFQTTFYSKSPKSFTDTNNKSIPNTFIAQFPTCTKIIRWINSKGKNKLCEILQRHESRFFLNYLCENIRLTNHNIPIFTIHDSILTTESFEKEVKEIIDISCKQLVISPPKWSVNRLGSLISPPDSKKDNLPI